MPRKIIVPSDLHCVCGNNACTIPFGLCHCGCGNKTSIALAGRKKRGDYAGLPLRFVRSHATRIRPIIGQAMPFKIDGVYCRLIPLTQGYNTIVNAADYEWLMQWKWCAWKNKHGQIYAIRNDYSVTPKKTLGMHVVIMQPPAGMVVDHESGITLDNRRGNLRIATQQQNTMNARIYKTNKTGVKGVFREGNVYVASIRRDGKQVTLGRSKNLEEATALRRAAEKEQYGRFARSL